MTLSKFETIMNICICMFFCKQKWSGFIISGYFLNIFYNTKGVHANILVPSKMCQMTIKCLIILQENIMTCICIKRKQLHASLTKPTWKLSSSAMSDTLLTLFTKKSWSCGNIVWWSKSIFLHARNTTQHIQFITISSFIFFFFKTP